MEMTIVETATGLNGDTSGRVMKRLITDTGAKIQVPIFIDQGEIIKVDTRTGEYVSVSRKREVLQDFSAGMLRKAREFFHDRRSFGGGLSRALLFSASIFIST